MACQEIRPEFAELLSRHGGLVVLFGDSLRGRLPGGQINIARQTGRLRQEERQLRACIINWVPINATEARRKLEHLARFVAATGVAFDDTTLDMVLRSIMFFFETE